MPTLGKLRQAVRRERLDLSATSILYPRPSSNTMAAAPTKEAVRQLYANTLRASRAFSSYNFREYFVRRTKDEFRVIQVRLLRIRA